MNLKGFTNHLNSSNACFMAIVATITLGSRPRQGFAKMRAKSEAWESHFHAFMSVGECEGMNPHTPK
jgi:hypothetical protein